MFGDECQAEAGADPMACRRSASEPLEDAFTFALCDTGAAVLDRKSEPAGRGSGQLDSQGATSMVACVLQQVAENTFEPDLVERDLARRALHGDDRDVGFTESRGHPTGQVDERHVFDVEIGCSGVEACEFQ